jgi:hypothetical protein
LKRRPLNPLLLKSEQQSPLRFHFIKKQPHTLNPREKAVTIACPYSSLPLHMMIRQDGCLLTLEHRKPVSAAGERASLISEKRSSNLYAVS